MVLHGFYLNEQMKWTFKSHKGFFVPVIYNNRIKGLRIHLEKEYKLETTDIWFSSSKEYRGANAKNHILILVPDNKTNLELMNRDKKDEKDIVITSEMLLAYKAYSTFHKITIGLPNTISKKQSTGILQNINVGKADIFLDRHTVFTDPFPIYKNLLDKIDENKRKIEMIFDNADMAKIKSENIAEAA